MNEGGAVMDQAEIYETLTGIFRSALGDESIVLSSETTPNDIEKWDSFRYVDIILRIEELMNVRIRAKEANQLKTVGEMVALIHSKQAI
jgi:acyl carrier protein